MIYRLETTTTTNCSLKKSPPHLTAGKSSSDIQFSIFYRFHLKICITLQTVRVGQRGRQLWLYRNCTAVFQTLSGGYLNRKWVYFNITLVYIEKFIKYIENIEDTGRCIIERTLMKTERLNKSGSVRISKNSVRSLNLETKVKA